MSAQTMTPRAATPIPRRPRLLLPPSARRSTPSRRTAGIVMGPSPSKSIVFARSEPLAIHKSPSSSSATVPDAETLRTLRRTRSLFLCCRNLVSLSHVRHFERMTGLVSLNAHMNALVRLEGLSHLQHLTELDVSANELRVVDSHAFEGLRQLRRLNLSSNFLRSVSGFEHLPALEWLSLSFNELSDMRALRRLPSPQQLLHLDVCGNRIATCADLVGSLTHCVGLLELRTEAPQAALVLPSAPPQLRLRENPFCAAEPDHVEQLLHQLPRLARLNGVPCGVDPTAALQLEQQRERLPLPDDNHEMEKDIDASLNHTAPTVLSPPLLSSSSSSSSSSSPSSSSLLFTPPPPPLPPCKVTLGVDTNADCCGCDSRSPSHSPQRRHERPRRVSRGVVTDLSVSPRETVRLRDAAAEAASAATVARLEVAQQRSQEQLALRAAHETDLRRHVDDAHRGVAAAVGEARLLRRQVAALKEELSRRAQESAAIARRHRAEMEAQSDVVRRLRRECRVAVGVAHLQLEEAAARRDAETAALRYTHHLAMEWTAAWRADRGSLLSAWGAHQRAWEAHAATLRERHRRELTAALERPKTVDTSCDPMGEVCDMVEVQQFVAARDAALANASEARDEVRIAHIECERLRQMCKEVQEKCQEALATAATDTTAWQEEAQRLRVDCESAMSLRAKAEADSAHAQAEAQRLQVLADEAAVERRAAETAAALERENLLRTVRNLRESIAAKDSAFQELEREATEKIDEKRAVIVRLEGRLTSAEAETTALRRARESESPCAKADKEKEAREALEEARRRCVALESREAQQSVVLARAGEALGMLRAQLTRVDAANERLERQCRESESAVAAKETELQQLRAQWRDAETAARARQRATLQALSQIMVEGPDTAL